MLDLDHLKRGFAIRVYHAGITSDGDPGGDPNCAEYITEFLSDALFLAKCAFEQANVYKVHVFDNHSNKVREFV